MLGSRWDGADGRVEWRGFRVQGSGFRVIGHWSLVIGHWSLVIGHWSGGPSPARPTAVGSGRFWKGSSTWRIR
jgi:hypothetical protein